MKRCPTCNRFEADDVLAFCRADGTALVSDSGSVSGDAGTMKFGVAPVSSEIETSILPHTTDAGPIRPTAPTTVLPAQSLGTTQELSRPKRLRVVLPLAALAIVIITVAGYFYFSRRNNATIQSIAVMPFVNESGNDDNEYLSDGMTETLISSLSQLPNLNVKPRSSVFRYKGKETNPQTIAKELNVQAILNGRVVQRGQDISLFVELIDISLDKVIWSETYNRRQSDLVTLQSDIARDVSNKLKTKLSSTDEAKVTKTYTTNTEAYQLYLKGNYHYAKRTRTDIFKGIEYFQQAIKLDYNFAQAYVGIADSYNSLVKNSDLLPKDAFPQAKEAATRTLEINPDLAEAHAALADSLAIKWMWTEAGKEFKRAIGLNPNVAYTHVSYGTSYLVPMGRTNEAVKGLERAVELEPLSLISNAVLVSCYLYARQNDKALEQAKKTYDLDPTFRFGQQWLGQAFIANGNYNEAINLAEKSLKSFPFSQESIAVAGQAYAKSGRRQEAEQYIKKLGEISKTQPVRFYWSAAIYAALGDKDKAFAELEKAYEQRDWFLPRLKVDPSMDSLRDDPRYKDLLRRMNLPE